MARPTKLTEDLQKRVCSLLRAGNFVETAVKACGVAVSTHYDWLAKAELLGDVDAPELKGKPLEAALTRAGLSRDGTAAEKRERVARLRAYKEGIEDALAEGESIAVTVLVKAGRKDWRAVAWYLERAHPGRWAKKPGGAPDDPPAGGDGEEGGADGGGDQAGL